MNTIKAVAAVAALTFSTGAVNAATYIDTFDDNDPFPGALSIDGIVTPALYKCDVVKDGCSDDPDNTREEFGDGSISIKLLTNDDHDSDDDELNGFAWEYMAGEFGLAPHYVAVKAGNEYDLYRLDDGEVPGTLFTTSEKAVSHVSFYNTGVNVVPLPAAGFLLLGALGGLAAMRRRK